MKMRATVLGILLFGISLNGEAKTIFDFPWKWKAENGAEMSLSELKGKPIVITMTYTSCKMSCPITIRTLKEVSKDLEKKLISAHFVVVSFDPRMDTPRKLSAYKKSWNLPEQTWHFLTGDEKTLKELEKFLDFEVTYIDDHFIHDKKIILIDRDGSIKTSFESWNSDIAKFLAP